MGTIAGEITRIQAAKAAIKGAIEAKGVAVESGLIDTYADKVSQIGEIQGTGQHLVVFYDYDGIVLKRQRVNTGEDATPPAIPTHEYLTFAEWNNPYTNVQSDVDTGAIYNTTDGKTYLFITLTPITGLTPTLYFYKKTASEMSIDWGDGTITTTATYGNNIIQHNYSAVGDYVIKIDNSKGSTWTFGHGNAATAIFANGIYSYILSKVYIGNFVEVGTGLQIQKFKYLSIGNKAVFDMYTSLQNCSNLEFVILPFALIPNYGVRVWIKCRNIVIKQTTSIIGNNGFDNTIVRSLKFGSSLSSIYSNAFLNCSYLSKYIFLSTTPPTLANINAFSGINPLCRIYVPDASVDAYKAATNWVTYANYIYPLSQKPQSNE